MLVTCIFSSSRNDFNPFVDKSGYCSQISAAKSFKLAISDIVKYGSAIDRAYPFQYLWGLCQNDGI